MATITRLALVGLGLVLTAASSRTFPQWTSVRYTLAGGAAVGDWPAADNPLSAPILQAELGEVKAAATATAGGEGGPIGGARTAWLLTTQSLVCCADAANLSTGCHTVGFDVNAPPMNLTAARLIRLGTSAAYHPSNATGGGGGSGGGFGRRDDTAPRRGSSAATSSKREHSKASFASTKSRSRDVACMHAGLT